MSWQNPTCIADSKKRHREHRWRRETADSEFQQVGMPADGTRAAAHRGASAYSPAALQRAYVRSDCATILLSEPDGFRV